MRLYQKQRNAKQLSQLKPPFANGLALVTFASDDIDYQKKRSALHLVYTHVLLAGNEIIKKV